MQATECKASARKQEDIPGSFKYHGFLEHAFRLTSPGQEEQPMFWLKDKWNINDKTKVNKTKFNFIYSPIDEHDRPSKHPRPMSKIFIIKYCLLGTADSIKYLTFRGIKHYFMQYKPTPLRLDLPPIYI